MMDMNAKDAGPKNPDRRTFIKKAALLTTMLAFDPGKVLEAIAGEEPSLSERRPDGNGEFLDRLRKGAPAAEIRLENDGDPHKGRVVNIRQLHDRPEFGPEQKQLVAEYQMEILRFLDHGKFEHVFVESLFEDLRPREKAGNGMVNVAKFVFDGGVPANPNTVQKDMLVEVGASQIYAFLNDRVTLHKTYTPEESAKIDGMVKALGYGNPESLKLMTARREELAVGEVERFLKESPGSIAALVFGAAHSFKPYFSGSVAPALYSVSFPEILGRFQAQAMSGRHSRPESVEKQGGGFRNRSSLRSGVVNEGFCHRLSRMRRTIRICSCARFGKRSIWIIGCSSISRTPTASWRPCQNSCSARNFSWR